MDFSIEDIRYEIESRDCVGGTWGFGVRYWLHGRKTGTTSYQFKETFPTREEMLDFAERATYKHFRENGEEILMRLADLAK